MGLGLGLALGLAGDMARSIMGLEDEGNGCGEQVSLVSAWKDRILCTNPNLTYPNPDPNPIAD